MDASGNSVASYSYDAFGQLTSFSESFGSGVTWTNPYRYDGRDGVRYDGETGLYWMSVRAYDPALGRFQLQCHSSSCWIMLAVELRNALSARKQGYPQLHPKTPEICLLTQARIPEPTVMY